MQGSSIPTPPLPFQSCIGSIAGDFDRDGFEDVILGYKNTLFVAWNSKDGLGPFVVLAQAEGIWDWIKWDPETRICWFQSEFPSRIQSLAFENRQLRPRSSYTGNALEAQIVSGAGLLVTGREGSSMELLSSSGVAYKWITDASGVLRAQALVNGQDLLVIQDKTSNSLGFSFREDNSNIWPPVTWLEDSKDCRNWWLMEDEKGPFILHVKNDSLQLNHLYPDGSTRRHWKVQLLASKTTRMKILTVMPLVASNAINIIWHKPIFHQMGLTQIDLATGALRQHLPLAEFDAIKGFSTPDLNGDGSREILHLRPDGTGLECHMNWQFGTQMLYHSAENQPAYKWPESALKPMARWTHAMDIEAGLEELWMHNGALLFRNPDGWWKAELQPNSEPAEVTEELQSDSASLRLVVSYLHYHNGVSDAGRKGLAEVTLDEWHHVTFIRKSNLESQVWYDGQLIFDGFSLDLRFQYNALMFGATYGTRYFNHAPVALDRVILSGKAWTSSEIEEEWLTAGHTVDDMTAEVWEFDEIPFKSSIAQKKLDAASQPSLVPGRSGNAVLFDGIDDRLRSFTNVPSDDLTLSFHFKVSPNDTYSSHTVATLYGMYNTTIGMEWSEQPLLRSEMGGGGTITSPSPVSVAPLPWPSTASPFLYEGVLYVMTAGGQVLVEGPLGWQEFPLEGDDIAGRLGNPWPTQEGVCALSDEGLLWSWAPTSGWNSLGAVQNEYKALREVIPCGDGAFLQGENQWVWADSDPKDLQRPANGAPGLVREVAWSLKGHEVTFEKGDRQFWHPLRTQMLLGPTGVTLTKRWSWYSLLPVLCIALAIATIVRFRKRQNQRDFGSTSPYRSTPPQDLQPLLMKLQAHCGQAIETSQLDEIFGVRELDTDETRRARRARLIKETNHWSQDALDLDVIVRKRDPKDRRRALYLIHPVLKASLETTVSPD
ncbi:MAG: VCBS repeat-containing protein [Flavobacteriales bacterium]|nr:VCBS repeat-containing protein [Flavobacteriales bacterium]